MSAQERNEPKIFRTLRDDVQRGNFSRSVKDDFAELKEVMLDEQRRKRLGEMGWLGRTVYGVWWLFRSLVFRLAPARRIILFAGLLLIILSRGVVYSDDHLQISGDTNGLGILCILFVLGLELKDKLLAKKELEAGRAIQKALMPDRTPGVPGWDLWLFTRSANEVGGDLVDFIEVTEKRFGITLADVSGKGLSAALLSVKLQATLRAIAADFRSLGDLASKLNTVFCRECLPGVFASLVYIEGEGESGALRLVNAGHLPPVVVKGATLDRLEKGGPALGIMPAGNFVEHRLSLQRSEFIVIFSDGVTEAQNERGEFFGEQRLNSMLLHEKGSSAAQCGERVVAEVDMFVGESKVHDDLSLVVLRRL